MAIDAFLQFGKGGAAGQPFDGETQDGFFKTKKPVPFELSTWSFGASNKATIGSATSGAGSGKAEFEPFKVTKVIDTATPYLFQTCCAGAHFEELTLWVRKSGSSATDAGTTPYLEWKFAMAFVQEIAWSNNDPQPTEEVTFVYGAIQFTYNQQSQKGDLAAGESKYQWSQVHNAPEYEVT
jgi:type VI secretion system secreted protein Hcp